MINNYSRSPKDQLFDLISEGMSPERAYSLVVDSYYDQWGEAPMDFITWFEDQGGDLE